MKNGSFLQVSPQVWLRGEKLDKHLKKKKNSKDEKKNFQENTEFCFTWLSCGTTDQSPDCNMDTRHTAIS